MDGWNDWNRGAKEYATIRYRNPSPRLNSCRVVNFLNSNNNRQGTPGSQTADCGEGRCTGSI